MSNDSASSMLTKTTFAQKSMIARVERMLIAPCCYTQSIDVHSSEIAETMRREVTTMVFSGVTERSIFLHYKTLYGERILMVPDGLMGQAVSAVPVTTFALASGFLFLVLRKVHMRKRLAVVRAIEPARSEEKKVLLERIRREVEW